MVQNSSEECREIVPIASTVHNWVDLVTFCVGYYNR